MSLTTSLSSHKSKSRSRAGYTETLAAVGRRTSMRNIFEAIAEARMQRAMIEAELYCNRYRHSSKNDDDLPVFR